MMAAYSSYPTWSASMIRHDMECSTGTVLSFSWNHGGMFVAVDDTDSMKGNCTTFLATEIIREFMDDLDLIGNPRLVRLNPAVPWKARGNGSLVMRFGKGTGPKRFIGRIGDRDVFCYDRCTSFEPDPVMMRDRIIPHIEDHHEDDSDPGLLISKEKPSQSF